MPQDKTPLQIYEEIQAMVRKDAHDEATKVYKELGTRTGVARVPLHIHNGVDTPMIPQSSVIPNLRATGSITMATDGTRYRLGLTFTPRAVSFNGIAIHRTGGTIDIRAHVNGDSQLGPSYYFQPQSGTSVITGGPLYNVIQSSNALLIDSSTSPVTVRAIVSEGHLVSVEYGGVVARATIPNLSTGVGDGLTGKGYGEGYVFVDVTLAADWEIIGNFVVT